MHNMHIVMNSILRVFCMCTDTHSLLHTCLWKVGGFWFRSSYFFFSHRHSGLTDLYAILFTNIFIDFNIKVHAMKQKLYRHIVDQMLCMYMNHYLSADFNNMIREEIQDVMKCNNCRCTRALVVTCMWRTIHNDHEYTGKSIKTQ
jgi:hypothetical protein